jgi:hypothetical protein
LIARAYCVPRKMSSSSLSRRIICDHVGMATLSMTAMTAMPTSSAAMAYPASARALRRGKPALALGAKFMGLL